MNQISNVRTDILGRLISYTEGPYNVTVCRDSVGRPLALNASSINKPTLRSEFKYTSNKIFTGTAGNFVSSMMAMIVAEAINLSGPDVFVVDVPTSRTILPSDVGGVLGCAEGIVLTLPNDAALDIVDSTFSPKIGFSRPSMDLGHPALGAVTLITSAVTMRGTMSTSSYWEIRRVGANTWEYVPDGS